MRKRWLCEICLDVTFDTKEECEEHEAGCNVLERPPCVRCKAVESQLAAAQAGQRLAIDAEQRRQNQVYKRIAEVNEARAEADQFRARIAVFKEKYYEHLQYVLDGHGPSDAHAMVLSLEDDVLNLDANPPECVRGILHKADPLYLSVQPASAHCFKPRDSVLIIKSPKEMS